MKILHYGPEPCFLYDPICWLHLVNISMTIPLHMMDAPAVQVAVKNWAALLKRHDNSLLLRMYNKNKNNAKVAWSLLKVNLRIPDLIWRGTAYFVQNNTAITLPSDTRRTTSELPCRPRATHFCRQIRSLETQNVSYFTLCAILYGFRNCKSLLVNI